MKLRLSIALLAGLALFACSPKDKTAERPATDDPNAEIVPVNPFFGKWQLVRAQIAPWWDHKGAEPAADTALTLVDFEAKSSSGAPIVTCSKPQYSVSIVTATSLFEGNLKEPFVEARQLGFDINAGEITSLNFSCKDDNKDVSLDFPMLNNDTILLGLDNIIYTLQRTAK
jgi:hypothetical protein